MTSLVTPAQCPQLRAYQDRGLLPPPRRDGRVGLYSEIHLSRLRLIAQLLDRGYTLANIAELLDAWERGHDLETVLGLEDIVSSPWSDEVPTYLTSAEFEELFPGIDPGFVEKAAALGLLEVEDDRLRVPSPRLLHAGAELLAAGFRPRPCSTTPAPCDVTWNGSPVDSFGWLRSMCSTAICTAWKSCRTTSCQSSAISSDDSARSPRWPWMRNSPAPCSGRRWPSPATG